MPYVSTNRYRPDTNGRRELVGFGSYLELEGAAKITPAGLLTREGTAACYMPVWTGGIQLRLTFSFEHDDASTGSPFAAHLAWGEASFSITYYSGGSGPQKAGIHVRWMHPNGKHTSFVVPSSKDLHATLGKEHTLVVQLGPDGVSVQLDGGRSVGVAARPRLLAPGHLIKGPTGIRFGGPAYERLSGPRVRYRAIDISTYVPPGIDLAAARKAWPMLRTMRTGRGSRVQMEVSAASNQAWVAALRSTAEGREAAAVAARGGGTAGDFKHGVVLGRALAGVASAQSKAAIASWHTRVNTDSYAARLLQYAPLLRGFLEGSRGGGQ